MPIRGRGTAAESVGYGPAPAHGRRRGPWPTRSAAVSRPRTRHGAAHLLRSAHADPASLRITSVASDRLAAGSTAKPRPSAAPQTAPPPRYPRRGDVDPVSRGRRPIPTTRSVGMSPTDLSTRPARACSRGPFIAVIAAAIAGLALVRVASVAMETPDSVDRITFVNGTPYGVDVDLRNSDRGGVLLLGRVLPEQDTAKHEVYDGGDHWIFEFTRGGVVAGEVAMTRDELDHADWRVTVPDGRRAAARRRRAAAVPGRRLALSDRSGPDRRLLQAECRRAVAARHRDALRAGSDRGRHGMRRRAPLRPP